ncbi:hypothetical protein Tco_0915680 [Tanacetum coccineum]
MARHRRIPSGATTGASGYSDDGATIADGVGKMEAVGISRVEVVGDTCLLGISVSDSESSHHENPSDTYSVQAPFGGVTDWYPEPDYREPDNSESDTKLPERHVSFAPHDAMLARWRSRVASRPSSPSGSSSPTTSTLEIPTAPISPTPSTDIISPDIPVGRLYRTHPGGPCKALTARKSVRPLLSHHLASRYTSHHLDRFTSGSSSDHSSLDHSSSDHSSSGHSTSEHSSFGHSTSGHSSSGHTPPFTTIVDSSTPSRFVYPPLVRTSRYSEAYRRWRSAPLSTMYPLTTSESSAGDSSSESSAGLFRKRCVRSCLSLIIHNQS